MAKQPKEDQRMSAAPQDPTPDEVCPNGCERFGDWWVPEDCPKHLPGG